MQLFAGAVIVSRGRAQVFEVLLHLFTADARQDGKKLVTAVPPDEILLGDGRPQDAGEVRNQRIACEMSEVVVYLL